MPRDVIITMCAFVFDSRFVEGKMMLDREMAVFFVLAYTIMFPVIAVKSRNQFRHR